MSFIVLGWQMYHWPLNWWILYKVNAWFYMVTRLGIAVISLWTWWDAKHDVWNDPIMYPTIVSFAQQSAHYENALTGGRNVAIRTSCQPYTQRNTVHDCCELVWHCEKCGAKV